MWSESDPGQMSGKKFKGKEMDLTNLASAQLVAWKMMQAHNVDPIPVFKKAQLDPDLMYRSGARYPLPRVEALWREMESRIEDPCFGLMAADPKCCHPSYFGALGYAMLASTSLRMTLERLIRFHRVLSEVSFGRLNEDPQAGTLVFTFTNRDGDHYITAREDASLAWLMSTLKMNFQDELTAASVHFVHSRPECAERYSELFKSPISFNSPVTSLALSLEDADRILPSGNDELAAFHDQIMTHYLITLDQKDLLAKVRRLVVEHLPSGDAKIGKIASELGYSARTFQRLLKQKGTTFITLLNEVRMRLAVQYVRDKSKNLTEIAFLLGFAELSTFSRSFKRWTGKSLQQYRQAAS